MLIARKWDVGARNIIDARQWYSWAIQGWPHEHWNAGPMQAH